MSAVRRPSSSKRSNAAVFIGTLLVLLVATEVVLRIVYDPPIVRSAIRYDPLLGWSLKPGSRIETDMPERGIHTHVNVNSLGLRDRDVPVTHPGGRRRILIVGDSIAFGSGLEAPERFSDVLGHDLGDGAEVINAGVPGWGNDQELLFYEKRLRALKPDVVILAFTGNNDVVNNALAGALLEGATKPRFQLGPDSLAMTPPAAPAKPRMTTRVKSALKHSRTLVFVRRRLMRVTYRHRVHEETAHQVSGFEAYRDLSHWSVYENPGSDAVQSAWKVTEAIIGRFADDCRADSCRFVVFAMPLKLEVDDAWRSELIHGTDADSTRIDMAYPYLRLSDYCAGHGIEFYYPIDEFRAAAARERLYFDKDSHPNVRGNALAAEFLLSVLHS
ncbi:MAG TPA: GDSL-type esterase/lipase family protein [Candidatus Krumholzibacteria bacterium]